MIIDGTTEPDFAGTPIIELDGSLASGFDVHGLEITGGGTTVRGLVINGFKTNGILLKNNGGNLIEGNFIGTDVTGTVALGNNIFGVVISNVPDNTIGGTAAGAGNVISGNGGNGVRLSGGPTTGNLVQGNLIGTQIDGSSPLGNTLDGVRIAGATNNTVGGEAAGADNTIAYNGGDGVFVESGTGNAILGNSIHSNTGLGIDLGTDGVTPNDPGDVDPGANNLQNFPELTAASPGSTIIGGSLNSTASTTFRLEFFSNTTCDPSANGEGESFLGFADVNTDGTGNVSFNLVLTPTAPIGQFATATATASGGSTSEFSACVEVAEAPFVVNSVADGGDSNPGDGACNDGTGACTLRAAIEEANALVGTDTIAFNIPGTGPHTISSRAPPCHKSPTR